MIKDAIQNLSYYKKAKDFYNKYERWSIPAFLLLGFIVDVITFKSLDVLVAFMFLGVHLLIAGVAIAYINIFDEKWFHTSGKIRTTLRWVAPFAMQFSFGALLSATFIFYSFSGALFVSWPLILIIFFLMVANEIFKKYYLKPTVQISVYYFLIFSLFSLVFPFVFHSISPWFFILAGVSSLLVIYLYIYLVAKFHNLFRIRKPVFYVFIGTIFVFMNILYVFNRIPPVPMTLSEVGVYHNILHVGSTYNISQEKESLLDKITPGRTLHITPNEKVFIYASIFAPAQLNTTIVHHWQSYDEVFKEWKSESKFSYKISGGRKEGYRGFSVRDKVKPGRWRVLVETGRGQVLGRINFDIKRVDKKAELEHIVK